MATAESFLELVDTPDESGERRKPVECANDTTALPAETFDRRWRSAAEILRARIRAVGRSLVSTRRLETSRRTDWWVDDLEGVCSALDELCAVSVGGPAHLMETPRSPLAAYLTAAHVWCGDIVGDVEGFIRRPPPGAERRRAERTTFVTDSAAYVAAFLEPLFRALNEACWREPLAGARIRVTAERLQAQIVALNWELCGELMEGARDGDPSCACAQR